jgi:hypothetical protein
MGPIDPNMAAAPPSAPAGIDAAVAAPEQPQGEPVGKYKNLPLKNGRQLRQADRLGGTVDMSGKTADQPNVSPEEQQQYDMTMTLCLKQIYGDKQRLAVIIQKLAQGKEDLGKTVGHTAAMLLISVQRTIEKKKGKISDDVLFAVGQDVVAEIAQLAAEAGIIKPARVPAIIEAAAYQALKAYGDWGNAEGKFSKEHRAGAVMELGRMGITPTPGKGKAPAPEAAAAPEAAPAPAAQPPGGIVNAAAGV